MTIRSDCCTGFSSVVRGKKRSTWSQPLIHQINLANRSVSPRASWVSNTGSYTGLCCRPDNGERLARRWCAACHVVASDQRGLTGEEPPFATITAKPDFDAPRLGVLLAGAASENAKYAVISVRGGGPGCVYCDAQIARPVKRGAFSLARL